MAHRQCEMILDSLQWLAGCLLQLWLAWLAGS